MIGGDIVVDGVVDVAEMLLTLWEDGSFEKTWLSEWVSDGVKKWLLGRLLPTKIDIEKDSDRILCCVGICLNIIVAKQCYVVTVHCYIVTSMTIQSL